MPPRIQPQFPTFRVASVLLLLGTSGCGPESSDDELGRIVIGTPAIPAGYEPYELPDLTASPDEPTENPANPDEPPASASEQRGESSEEPAQSLEHPGASSDPSSDPAPSETMTGRWRADFSSAFS